MKKIIKPVITDILTSYPNKTTVLTEMKIRKMKIRKRKHGKHGLEKKLARLDIRHAYY